MTKYLNYAIVNLFSNNPNYLMILKLCINDSIVFKKFSSNYLVIVRDEYETNPLIKYVIPKLADIGQGRP